MENALKQIGLNKTEIKVYLMILQSGTSPASLIGKRLKLARSTAQYTCHKLVEKKLLRVIKKNNAFLFTPEPPDKILYLIEQEKKLLAFKEDTAKRIIGDLEVLYNPKTTLPKVQFYEGNDGIKDLLNTMIKEKRDLVSFGAGDYLLKNLPQVVANFRNKAFDVYEDIKVIRAKKYKGLHSKKQQRANIETKYFKNIEELKVDFQITNDKISIISADKNYPVGVLIQNEDIATAFKEIFAEVWDSR